MLSFDQKLKKGFRTKKKIMHFIDLCVCVGGGVHMHTKFACLFLLSRGYKCMPRTWL